MAAHLPVVPTRLPPRAHPGLRCRSRGWALRWHRPARIARSSSSAFASFFVLLLPLNSLGADLTWKRRAPRRREDGPAIEGMVLSRFVHPMPSLQEAIDSDPGCVTGAQRAQDR